MSHDGSTNNFVREINVKPVLVSYGEKELPAIVRSHTSWRPTSSLDRPTFVILFEYSVLDWVGNRDGRS